MAKFLGVWLLAACLTLALLGVVCEATFVQCFLGFFSRLGTKSQSRIESTTTEPIQNGANRIDTGNKRGSRIMDMEPQQSAPTPSAQLLDQGKPISAEQAYKLLKQLSRIERDAKSKPDFPYNVEKLLALSDKRDCDDLAAFELQSRFSGKYPSVQNYVEDCLNRHLENCNYNELFTRAVDFTDENGPEHWRLSPDEHPKLASFLTEKFSSELYSSDNFGWVVSTLKLIEPLGSISRDQCGDNELRKNLVSKLAKSKQKQPEMFTLVNAHFAAYLKACDLEAKFEQAMSSNGVDIEEGQFVLDNYLMNEFWTQASRVQAPYKVHEELLFALRLVDQLNSLGQISESKCNKPGYIGQLSYYNRLTKEKSYTKLHKCVNNIFTLQSKACERITNNR